MDQKSVKHGDSQEEADDAAKNEGLKARRIHRPIFYREFWSNHDIAIGALFIGGTLIATITEFVSGPKKIYLFFTGIWVIAGAFLFWLSSGLVHRAELSDEEISRRQHEAEEQYKNRIESKLGNMDSRLGVIEKSNAQRTLTPEQKSSILKSMAIFKGQKVVTEAIIFNDEAMNYANEIFDILRASGWDSKISSSSGFIPNFNVQIFLNDSYRNADGTISPDRVPPAAIALAKELKTLGLIDDPNWVGLDKSIPLDEIRIRVGAKRDSIVAPYPTIKPQSSPTSSFDSSVFRQSPSQPPSKPSD